MLGHPGAPPVAVPHTALPPPPRPAPAERQPSPRPTEPARGELCSVLFLNSERTRHPPHPLGNSEHLNPCTGRRTGRVSALGMIAKAL